jgi:hypothetical protein
MQQQEKGAKTPTVPFSYQFSNFEKNDLTFYCQKVLKSLGDCMMILN